MLQPQVEPAVKAQSVAILPGSMAIYADLFVWKSVPWLERAACRSHPDWWWFENGQTRNSENVRNRAKKICKECPMRWQCLAKYMDQPDGIWGGLDLAERQRLAPSIPTRLRGNTAVLRAVVNLDYREDEDGTLRVS